MASAGQCARRADWTIEQYCQRLLGKKGAFELPSTDGGCTVKPVIGTAIFRPIV
jgi:hypothetical protein